MDKVFFLAKIAQKAIIFTQLNQSELLSVMDECPLF